MPDGHLKYSGDGHLLYGSGGHLANECPTPTPTASPFGCLGCVPPLSDTLRVTLALLQADFACGNGAHNLPWERECRWGKWNTPVGDGRFYDVWLDGGFYVGGLPTQWWATFRVGYGPETKKHCHKGWRLVDSTCEPEGTYTEILVGGQGCIDSTCVNTASCELSLGATCVVVEL